MLYFPNREVVADRARPAAKWTEHVEPEDRDTPALRVTLAPSARPDARRPCAS